MDREQTCCNSFSAPWNLAPSSLVPERLRQCDPGLVKQWPQLEYRPGPNLWSTTDCEPLARADKPRKLGEAGRSSDASATSTTFLQDVAWPARKRSDSCVSHRPLEQQLRPGGVGDPRWLKRPLRWLRGANCKNQFSLEVDPVRMRRHPDQYDRLRGCSMVALFSQILGVPER